MTIKLVIIMFVIWAIFSGIVVWAGLRDRNKKK